MDPHPWWVMDMVDEHCLGFIDVSLRIGYDTIRADVRAGLNSNFTENQECGSQVTKAQCAERRVVAFRCDPPVRARYISIDLPNPGLNVVAVAEVAVEELSYLECSSYQDVPVLGKSATQSAQTTYPAVNAIDGDRNTFSLTDTLGGDLQLWWQVDLTDTHCLGRISIELGAFGNRSSDVVSRVGISSRYNTHNQQCGSIVTAEQVYDGAMIYFVCDPPLKARYVTLEMDLMDGSVLSIAEVTIEEHSTPQCPLPAGN
ncbi:uncharacterized protein [Asterias amurensis]|uniref:uncharacterized protein n=1 Tax=Asterias amurensis TaxID=7602 RepID=UPI003AB184C5